MNKLQNYIHQFAVYIRANGILGGKITRDPRYVIGGITSFIVLFLATLQAYNPGFLDSVERPIFNYFNTLPAFFLPFFFFITQLGSFFAIFFWTAFGYILGKGRLAFIVLTSGISTWILAKILKDIVGRDRPAGLFEAVELLSTELFSGFGFPSGHSAVIATCIGAIYFQVDRVYRKYLLLIVLLVGISRMYLGGHFPLDVVGGWALGCLVASVLALAIGTRRPRVNYAIMKQKLQQYGYEVVSLKQLSVDARGSTPFIAETKQGMQLFLKVFGKQEHAADWLFKSFRFIRYKSHFNEDAYISSKRNMEIEALGGMWAYSAGVRTPKPLVMFPLDSRWVLVQEMVNAKGLDTYKKIKTVTIADAWKQLAKLHAANISHRDLRAANIMVKADGSTVFIDFGFSEIAPNVVRKRIDVAQLLVTLALASDIKRTATEAKRHVDNELLEQSLPYLQTTILPAATKDLLKAEDSDFLKQLEREVKKQLKIKQRIEKEELKRVDLKKIFIFALFAFFLYSIVPQFNEFKGSFGALADAQIIWVILLLIASFMTYVFSALVMYVLITIPVKFIDLLNVQLAGSFVSKLVPGGVGAATLNLQYLRKTGLSVGEASAVISLERIVGFVGIVLLLLGFSIFGNNNLSILPSVDFNWIYAGIGILVSAIIAAILIKYPKLRTKLVSTLCDVWNKLRELASSPQQLSLSVLSGLGVTAAYVLCLYFSLEAVGGELSLLQILLVYLSAIIAKGVSPTPGGLGALELAMAASMQGFGVPATTTYATVVLYRLATYWLPLPIGLAIYKLVVSKKIV